MNRNFNDIYQEIQAKGVEEINALRKKKNMSLVFFVVIMMLALVFLEKLFRNDFIVITMLVLIFASLLNFILVNSKYKKMFKTNIIKKIIYLYNSKLAFDSNRGVNEREYRDAYFDRVFDKFYSEDLIEGSIDENSYLRMSQVRVSKEEFDRDSDGKIQKREITLFSGLFGVVDTKNKVLSELELVSNNFLNRFSKSRIEVDSQEFEKQYDMFSSDKVRTMEIFTPELIEEFNKFKEDTGLFIQIKILSNKLFFRISCGEAFEAPLIKSAMDYSTLYKYFRMIDSPITIVTKVIENA